MRIPKRLEPLLEYGVIDKVVRSLLSGKEAQVYLVESGGELRAAKVYKEAKTRSFRNRSGYTEGRKVRNSRDQRAMEKRTRHGREAEEAGWKAAEAETIYKLDRAGIRVPKPHAFVDGVLVMECIEGKTGGPAPRLADCNLDPAHADAVFDILIREVVKMLCAGVVHGDLSPFNVLMSAEGPVIIDFPQAIDAARNSRAQKILIRDVGNLIRHFKHGRSARNLRFAHEMWDLYERGELTPDTQLSGQFKLPDHKVDTDDLINQMREIEEDDVLDNDADGLDFEAPPARLTPRRRVSPGTISTSRTPAKSKNGKANKPPRTPEAGKKKRAPAATSEPTSAEAKPRRRRRGGRGRVASEGGEAKAGVSSTENEATQPANHAGQAKPKRRRRRRRKSGDSDESAGTSQARPAQTSSNRQRTASSDASGEPPPRRRRRRRRRGGSKSPSSNANNGAT